jgi:hypothetical protein
LLPLAVQELASDSSQFVVACEGAKAHALIIMNKKAAAMLVPAW